MVKEEIKVIEGFENIHAELVEAKKNIEEEVRREVEKRAERIDRVIAEITEVVEVEVPDEVEETETTEETVTY